MGECGFRARVVCGVCWRWGCWKTAGRTLRVDSIGRYGVNIVRHGNFGSVEGGVMFEETVRCEASVCRDRSPHSHRFTWWGWFWWATWRLHKGRLFKRTGR
ncbi:hypothetical protein SEA_BEELZEBUB_1 [Mycobacterium phage Beelzebub]|uniref:Uncharacterized protein n=3 Tax=Marvinvirus TaxID=1982091 RepID=A0A3G8FEN1_9CAUD|nr:hypothetical protein SEA_BEELZEBUB_1 [Mycobacterium phage Beelzebub]